MNLKFKVTTCFRKLRKYHQFILPLKECSKVLKRIFKKFESGEAGELDAKQNSGEPAQPNILYELSNRIVYRGKDKITCSLGLLYP